MKYACYGEVRGGKFLGTVEADSPEEAKQKAWDLEVSVSLCHHCANQINDPEVTDVTVEVEEESDGR